MTNAEPTPNAVATPHPVVATQPQPSPTPPLNPTTSLQTPLRSADVSKALGVASDIQSLSSKFNPKTQTFETSLFGVWNGRLLRGLIRSIEFEYKAIKRNTTRKAVAQIASDRKKQEALKPVVNTKGVGDAIKK